MLQELAKLAVYSHLATRKSRYVKSPRHQVRKSPREGLPHNTYTGMCGPTGPDLGTPDLERGIRFRDVS